MAHPRAKRGVDVEARHLEKGGQSNFPVTNRRELMRILLLENCSDPFLDQVAGRRLRRCMPCQSTRMRSATATRQPARSAKNTNGCAIASHNPSGTSASSVSEAPQLEKG